MASDFGVPLRLGELERAMKEDHLGIQACALIDRMALAALHGTATSGPDRGPTGQVRHEGFEAAQRIVRQIWGHLHGSVLSTSSSLSDRRERPAWDGGEALEAVLDDLQALGLLGRLYRCDPQDLLAVDATVDGGQTRAPHVLVQRAMADCIAGDVETTRPVLERHIETHPDDDMAKIVLGAAMLAAGDRQGQSWLDVVLATSSVPSARESALAVARLFQHSSGG